MEQKVFVRSDWIRNILDRERECHLIRLGMKSDLSKFEEKLKEYGYSRIKEWLKMGREVHFLPGIVMVREIDYPGLKIKLPDLYYDDIKTGKVLRNLNGTLVVNKNAFMLDNITVLVDTNLKPNYNNGKQMYDSNDPLGPIIKRLRKYEKIAPYAWPVKGERSHHGPQSSSFGASPDEWEEEIKPLFSKSLEVTLNQSRFETVVEAVIISQLYPHMPRKNDGNTNTWVWYEERYKNADNRYFGGNSDYGGLEDVNKYKSNTNWNHRSIRPIVEL